MHSAVHLRTLSRKDLGIVMAASSGALHPTSQVCCVKWQMCGLTASPIHAGLWRPESGVTTRCRS